MHPFPHSYQVSAIGESTEAITISAAGLPDLEVDSPPEFDGPGDLWSPETMLVGAVANCFILTWRSFAAHNNLPWADMKVDVTGVLDRVERVTRFTRLELKVQVAVPAGTDLEKTDRLLHRAEAGCLITNSMNAEINLETLITEV